MSSRRIVLAGNPNCGKTTLFNALTGSQQKVGNWAGVTVDKKVGTLSLAHNDCQITDLPGLYALNAGFDASIDEQIATYAIDSGENDFIINVLDANCLERGLYLTLQLRERGVPMVVVINKMDLLDRNGQQLDTAKLQTMLGCPVLTVTACQPATVDTLRHQLAHLATHLPVCEAMYLNYGAALENWIQSQLGARFLHAAAAQVNQRAHLLECLERGRLPDGSTEADQQQFTIANQALSDLDTDIAIADTRYSAIRDMVHQARRELRHLSRNNTEKLDKVLLNPFLSLPILLAVLYAMFVFAINIGGAFIDFFDIAAGAILVDGTHQLLDGILPTAIVTILADGLGGGIQTVATFIPVIAGLYLFLTVLESTGYMARAAFLLDGLMQKMGLPGKAFVPLILGFGCTVPAVMATRTLEQVHERKTAAAMATFMSCGARLPVYALFAAAFFPQNGQNLVFGLYLLGIIAAIITGLILRHTLYPGHSESLLMTLPDYELPRVRHVMSNTWQKLRRFVLGAGKTIVIVVTILTFFNSLGTDGSFGHEDSESSVLSKTAQVITPALSPIGIEEDNWPATVGLVTGLFAKEAVVGTLNNLYAPSEEAEEEPTLGEALVEAVQSIPENLFGIDYTDPLAIDVGEIENTEAAAQAQEVSMTTFDNLHRQFTSTASVMAYLIVILLYTPCVAALGAYTREFGRRFALFVASWSMLLAVSGATLCYQFSQLSVATTSATLYITGLCALLIVVVALMRYVGKHPYWFKETYYDPAKAQSQCHSGECH
ncbi:Fe(2+) transporter permease subunit FeoB [Salinivibrio kushneri]|uniref:Fe(2+) transporter permease subunit FeoB n=1 Tax=Salinivibrio kushneri TaxID=1908198 RepID=UPI000984E888|nr:Fe(2+) transporter permease subunit FeoB [Salinivibrio kushneri]OOE50251.1 ferrous iron transport protein B [Salinivibrio kushneri]OOE59046.1 ferrous iron transport protein B [Salinivibrio kushneri]